MEGTAVIIDDQPVTSGFFGEGSWLSDYINPDEPDILMLWKEVTENAKSQEDRVKAAWGWVARNIRYKDFIKASINVEGNTSTQHDYWQKPGMCLKTGVGNCANKSFLLTSLLRNEFTPEQVHCVLGNLHNGKAEGHAWVEANLNGISYILESTREDVPPVDANEAVRYEPVHYFNDKVVYAIPGRTLMVPFSACYSTWLRDYLNWAYINGGQNG